MHQDRVYKNGSKVLLRLLENNGEAEGVCIPKEEGSTHLPAVLRQRSKVFSAVSKRLCTYLAKNTYIHTSVQKGGIPGMSGCLEPSDPFLGQSLL